MDLTYPKILQLSTTKKFKIFNIITFLIKNIDNKIDNISTTAGKKQTTKLQLSTTKIKKLIKFIINVIKFKVQ